MSDYRPEYRAGDSAATLRNWSFAIDVLYLLGAPTSGLTSLIGVIMAHIKVNQADPLWRSHFAFQIRTFWYSILFVILGVIMCVTIILLPFGIVLLTGIGIWVVARSIVGLIKTANNEPIPSPQSLLLGL